MADQPIDKSDVNKLVEATEKSTGRLTGIMEKLYENQVKSGTTAEIIKQSLPEVLTDTKFGKMADAMQKEADKDRSKDEKIQKTQNRLVTAVKNSLNIQNLSRKKTESAQKMVDAEESEKESRQKKWQAFQKTMMYKQGKALTKIAGSMFGKGYKVAKTGLMAVLGAAGLMVLYEFLNSKYWNDIINDIKDWDMEAFSKRFGEVFGGFYSYFMGGKGPDGKRTGGLFDRIQTVFRTFSDKGIIDGIRCMWTNFSGIEKAVLGIVALLVLRPVLGPLGLIAGIIGIWAGFRKMRNAIFGINKTQNALSSKATAAQRTQNLKEMLKENRTKPGTYSAQQLNQAAGAEKGRKYTLQRKVRGKMVDSTFQYKGQQFVDVKTGRVARRGEVRLLREGISSGAIKGRGLAGWTKRYPKILKFMRVPGLSAILSGPEAYDIMTNPQLSTSQKVARMSGLFTGILGSGIGAVVGAALGSKIPGIGTLVGGVGGGILGYFSSEMIGTGIMQYLLDEKVDAFPNWSGLNDWLNGKHVSKGAAGLRKTSSQLAARRQLRERFTGGKFYDKERLAALRAGVMSDDKFNQNFFGENLKYRLTAEDAKTFRLAGFGRNVTEGMTLDSILRSGGKNYFANQTYGFKQLQNRGIEEINELKKLGAGDIGAARIINQIITDNSMNGLGQQPLIVDQVTGTPYGATQVGSYY